MNAILFPLRAISSKGVLVAGLLAVSALLPGTSAFASYDPAAGSITASGAVVYRMKDGTLKERRMSLEVPSRGQGEVVLSGGSIELRSRNFRTEKKAGRTIFRVEFSAVPGAPAGSEMLLEGTYLRDSRKALYYGDIYGRNPQTGEGEWSHVGGFMFEAPVTR